MHADYQPLQHATSGLSLVLLRARERIARCAYLGLKITRRCACVACLRVAHVGFLSA
jgi:hypothetical protein